MKVCKYTNEECELWDDGCLAGYSFNCVKESEQEMFEGHCDTMKADVCAYTNKPCDSWGEEDGCLAIVPEQCPYNTEDDVAAIKDWQRRVCRTDEQIRAELGEQIEHFIALCCRLAIIVSLAVFLALLAMWLSGCDKRVEPILRTSCSERAWVFEERTLPSGFRKRAYAPWRKYCWDYRILDGKVIRREIFGQH